MNSLPRITLDNESAFRLVSGLWKGDRGPLVRAKVVRSTDFRRDGLLDYSNVAQLDVEERQLQARRLEPGDIVVERSGGGPRQPVGRVAIFDAKDDAPHASSNFTTSIRVIDKARIDPVFVSLYLHHLYLRGATQPLQRATTGLRNLAWSEYLKFEVPLPPLREQQAVGSLLNLARLMYVKEQQQLDVSVQLKQATMRELFVRGLRGEMQTETEVGPLPSTWAVVTLGSLGRIGNGSTPKRSNRRYWDGGTYPWLTSAKVYEREIAFADQFVTETAYEECHLPRLSPGSVLVAITGQGRTLGHCAVLRIHATINQHLAYVDTNLSLANPSFIRGYLETQYEYLRQVASGGGSTKGALTCAFLRQLKVPLPPTHDEQDEIVAILDAIDEKIGLHKKKRAVLDDLFKSLLHKLMTGDIRVSDLDLSALEETTAAQVSA